MMSKKLPTLSRLSLWTRSEPINVLKFMASNGLVANPQKTTLIYLNYKKRDGDVNLSLKVGNDIIEPENQAKLLGSPLMKIGSGNLKFMEREA